MGCVQSNFENEESVIRCKERKQHIKAAISARNAFASAHSSYTTSLKNLGAALNDYASAEFPHAYSAAALSQMAFDHSIALPPPPLPNLPPLQRASTMPELSTSKPQAFRSDVIVEEEEEEEVEKEVVGNLGASLKHRSSRRRGREIQDTVQLPIPPPSPPRTPPLRDPQPPPPPQQETDGPWDYFFPKMENVPGTSFDVLDEKEEDLSRSEAGSWGSRMYSNGTTSSMHREEIEREVFEEDSKRVRENEKIVEEEEVEVEAELPTPPPSPPVVKMTARHVAASAEGKKSGKGGSESVNLLHVFRELDECCLKASQSTLEVSKMLEANRLHYHSNFADDKDEIDHSARVMHVITWNKSYRGLSKNEDRYDIHSEKHETLAMLLEKMLAWEKKLSDEVKVGEQMKLEYNKKVASLNRLETRGVNTVSLERKKAAVSHQQTRYTVDMMSMDSTVSEINRLRDEQLHPKLVELVDGMATMWETMRIHHESQSKIGQALNALDISQSSKETSEHHHKVTVQLWAVVQEWHLQFEKLMSEQKKYVQELTSWLKLNLIPMNTDLKEKSSSQENPPIKYLLNSWHYELEKLRSEPARAAIHKFAAIINSIMQCQLDEMKSRDICEDTRREHNRKTQQFEDWYHKHMQNRTPPDELDPDRALNKQRIDDWQSTIKSLKKKLEENGEAYKKQCLQVRQKSCTSLKYTLPELFEAISEFSLASSDMYAKLISTTNTREL